MSNIIELTSINNDIVKKTYSLVLKKNRDEKILLEGEKSVLGALEAGYKIIDLFFEDEKFNFEAQNKYKVNKKILEKLSTTKSPAPVIATTARPSAKTSDFLKFKKIALFENIKDTGNLGTILRSAEAFGIEGIILEGNSTDPYSSKVIRASAGNIFKMPILENADLETFKGTHKFLTTVVSGGSKLAKEDTKGNFIIVFGSEADGVSREILTYSDKNITLPIKKTVESLNLAVCASIFFYEISKSE